MCSLQVAILTAVLLQVKTFVLYPHHYDQEVPPVEVQMFFKALATRSWICRYAFIGELYLFPLLLPGAPYVRVKYVAHRASCFSCILNTVSYDTSFEFNGFFSIFSLFKFSRLDMSQKSTGFKKWHQATRPQGRKYYVLVLKTTS